MNKAELDSLSKRWHDLSMVCWCRDGRHCSACREQDAIEAQAKEAGWNLFTKQRQRPALTGYRSNENGSSD